MNNAKMNETLNHINTVKTLATNNPSKCFRVNAGFYYISVDSVLWVVDYNVELSGNEKWIAYEDNNMGNAMYTDPYATKRELLEALRG